MTLTETMVALGVGSSMLGGLMITSTSLQRWFSAADFAIGCQQDSATAFDYMARDIRRASSVAVQNGDRKLTLTLPDQSNRTSDKTLNPPALVGTTIRYGTAPVTVSYYVQGNTFVREDPTSLVTLSTVVDEFHVDATKPPAVRMTLLFKPGPRKTVGQQAVTSVNSRNLANHLQ